jgi:ABC-type antimicrobial peptide transport system permease subunit
VLTDLGGVSLGVGLDAGAQGETDDLLLLPLEQYVRRWAQYAEEDGSFDVGDTPVSVQGQKRERTGRASNVVAGFETLVSRATAQPRFTARVVALFGIVALLLAAVGIYGTLSYVVRARSREIGIRLALGASRRTILSQTAWRGVWPALGGGFIGLALALVIARVFQAVFFDLSPVDPGSFIVGAVVLIIVAVGAALGPARQAARVDPATTLRSE